MIRYTKLEHSQDYLDAFGGEDKAEWQDLHYFVLYAKCIYYHGVSFGFEPMADKEYDDMEARYRDLSAKLNLQPSAANMVGWKPNALIEALAMRFYNPELYEKVKYGLFTFKKG